MFTTYSHPEARPFIEHVLSKQVSELIVASATSSDDRTSRCELDSHADTCVAGASALLIAKTGRNVVVCPFSKEYKPFNAILIATVATVWDDPATGQPYILIIHEAMYFGSKLFNTLLNPNQIRANGVEVHKVPRQFNKQSKQAFYFPEEKILLPLTFTGIISGFDCRKPTAQEYDKLPRLELTSNMDWHPSSDDFAEKEEIITATIANVFSEETEETYAIPPPMTDRWISAASTSRTHGQATELRGNLAERLVTAVNVAVDDLNGDGLSGHIDEVVYPMDDKSRQLFALSTEEKRSVLTPEVLAQRRWHIGLDAARRTMRCTTQAGIRDVLVPAERRTRQKLHHLKFPTVKGRFYTDTMFSKVESTRGNNAAQIFTNGLGYNRFYHGQATELRGNLAERLVTAVNVAVDDLIGDGLSGHIDKVVYPMDDKSRQLFALSTEEKRSVLTPEVLAQRRWHIGLDAARRTMRCTTQGGIRDVLVPAERRTRQKLHHLKFPTVKGRFYTDTMFSKVESTRGNNAAQIFTNGLGYNRFYPMKGKGEASEALMSFINDTGIPQSLVSDGALEESKGNWEKVTKKYHIRQKLIIPHSPLANLAESAVIPDENLVLLWPMGHGYPKPHYSRSTPIGWTRPGGNGQRVYT